MTHDVTRAHRARTAVVCMNIMSRRATEIRNDVLFAILKMPNVLKADHPKDEHRCRKRDAGRVPIPAIRETMSPIEGPEMPPMHETTDAGMTTPAVRAATPIPKIKIGMTRTAKRTARRKLAMVKRVKRMKRKTEIGRLHIAGTRAIMC